VIPYACGLGPQGELHAANTGTLRQHKPEEEAERKVHLAQDGQGHAPGKEIRESAHKKTPGHPVDAGSTHVDAHDPPQPAG